MINFPEKLESQITNRLQAKCPPTFEMSVCSEYVSNIDVNKKPSEEMANSSMA